MNRHYILSYILLFCVPRACGDEPDLYVAWRTLEGVFPAHAGMNQITLC